MLQDAIATSRAFVVFPIIQKVQHPHLISVVVFHVSVSGHVSRSILTSDQILLASSQFPQNVPGYSRVCLRPRFVKHIKHRGLYSIARFLRSRVCSRSLPCLSLFLRAKSRIVLSWHGCSIRRWAMRDKALLSFQFA